MKRKELWTDLRRVGSTQYNLNNMWLIQGDFNVVCIKEDRIGGVLVNAKAAIEFHNWILDLDLVEVQYTGSKFTSTKCSKEIGEFLES